MTVKEALERIRTLDTKIRAAEEGLRKATDAAEQAQSRLAEALAEGRPGEAKLVSGAAEAAIQAEAWRRAIERLRAEREAALGELLEVRAGELEDQAGRLEDEVAARESRAYQLLQKAGAALGYEEPIPLMLLYYRGLTPEDPKATEGLLSREWPSKPPRTVELAREARSLRERAARIRSHPGHRQEELALLLGEGGS